MYLPEKVRSGTTTWSTCKSGGGVNFIKRGCKLTP